MAEMPDHDDDLLGGGMLSQQELDSLLAAASAETTADGDGGWTEDSLVEVYPPMGGAAPPSGGEAIESPSAVASPAATMDLPSFDAPPAGASAIGSEMGGYSRVRDIPLEVTVELGRTRLLIRDILDLGAGSIIELDKIAGEPVDLFANGLLVARGEVVVIDDNFGVRVTEIITAAERNKETNALAA